MDMPLVPDDTLSSLSMIKKKVRRLTRSLSENQLSEAELEQYIDTFVLYDFPEHLRLFNLHKTLTFYTAPYIDVYSTTDTPDTDPLYNFKNRYITINPPIYVAGYQTMYCQSREQFFAIYPMLRSIMTNNVGDGIVVRFTGNINLPSAGNQSSLPYNNNGLSVLIRDNVLFDSIDANGNPLIMTDYPINATTGNLRVPNQDPTSTSVKDVDNYIDYTTGQFVVKFATAPASGKPVNSQTVPTQLARPQVILFYDGSFTVRPVPDQSYAVNLEVYMRPSAFLDDNTAIPELSEWWQVIALGAAKKIFEDRLDTESLSQMMPNFNEQMNLIQRRTIVQNTTQRTATIYTQQTGVSGAYGPNWFNGGLF